MIPYWNIIQNNLKGETLKEKFESLIKMKEILCCIAYPGRGTKFETMNIVDAAKIIEENFTLENLEIKD
jgi:hypothetical protein